LVEEDKLSTINTIHFGGVYMVRKGHVKFVILNISIRNRYVVIDVIFTIDDRCTHDALAIPNKILDNLYGLSK
jgi:hypothetical protein